MAKDFNSEHGAVLFSKGKPNEDDSEKDTDRRKVAGNNSQGYKSIMCHRCGKLGHIQISCRVKISKANEERVIVMVDNSTYPVVKKGVVEIGVNNTNIKLNDVYYVSGLKKKLVSVSQITNSEKYVVCGPDDVKVLGNMENIKAGVLFSIKKKDFSFAMSAIEAYVKKTSQNE
ncbi:hypothetical protein T459_03248 [Capsicum annuum]|uniref:CCHC-type domain-containing protein n=1 Tax=Capsicum annuum TaxID=4072 RepID=A0A2G3AMA3_CAPAN|nr:hypothetical protein T459_03248 [Capsicum annuum]